MEVISRHEALLSNFEVLQVLKEEDERHKKLKSSADHKYPENVTTLKFEALQYLSKTPCAKQSAEHVASIRDQLFEYELTKAEILQIINLRPKIAVELYLIIEECEIRFAMSDLEEILRIVDSTLPAEEEEEQEQEGEGDVEMEDNDQDNSNEQEMADEE
ncbi:hypothetical protein GGI12_003642 [Dipsacomyces acuminosporus]|nr:hypothetical protein GGI12_003642 [Dipsacomyces acuminosporus]